MIAVAILGIGGAWIYVGHRDRMELAQRFASATTPLSQPEATSTARSDSMASIETERLLDRARLSAAGGDRDRAIELCEELLRRRPLAHEGRLELAELLIVAGEAERARAHLELLLLQASGGDMEAQGIEDRVRELLR